MGTLAQALEPNKQCGPPCSMATLLANLDDDDRQTLEAWLADPTMQHARIARALQASGHDIKQLTVNRHRNGDCRCATR